jgi:hypothetical protein
VREKAARGMNTWRTRQAMAPQQKQVKSGAEGERVPSHGKTRQDNAQVVFSSFV